MKKQIIIPVIAFTIIGGVLLSTNVSAHGPEGKENVVQRIAEAFGVSEEEVQQVFDEYHHEHKEERQARFEAYLDGLIAQGGITAEQKALILEKKQELRDGRDDMRDEFESMTPEERRATRVAMKDELQAWAEENGIDLEVFNFRKMGMHKHHSMIAH